VDETLGASMLFKVSIVDQHEIQKNGDRTCSPALRALVSACNGSNSFNVQSAVLNPTSLRELQAKHELLRVPQGRKELAAIAEDFSVWMQ